MHTEFIKQEFMCVGMIEWYANHQKKLDGDANMVKRKR